ncbi:dTDP-4-dehydrorhamnose 3,5-epimerase [Candidatus Woesearchaeota archaeon]|nr:dTDP-4-dehydrorhamnose 3,5-epimerase [Candidatus Woesearchaeota archaeon]
MIFNETKIKGVYDIDTEPHEDKRGFFMRTYDDKKFKDKGLNRDWVQENHSFSKHKNIIRGLHFQFKPHGETKLVRVVSGEIYVVFADLRKDSDTFGKWGSITLSKDNRKMLYAPKGIAMGICTMTENCALLYKMDNHYAPESQGAIRWNDPDLAIEWPIDDPILSERDSEAMSFKEFVEKHVGLEE